MTYSIQNKKRHITVFTNPASWKESVSFESDGGQTVPLCLCHDLICCSTAVWFNLCEDKTTKSRIWQHKLFDQSEVGLKPKTEGLYKVCPHRGMRDLCFIVLCHCDMKDSLYSSESFHSLELDSEVYHTLLDNKEMNVSQLPEDTVNKGHTFN